MNLPKISIVTPSYNQGQFLEDTMLSVLGQNYPNLEYIIMDGGSTDSSKEIIKKYSNQLYYWVSEKDSGQSYAINSGFEKSSGEILMWLNSDDILMPNVLHKIADMYMKDDNVLYFGNCIHFESTSNGLSTFGSNVEKKNIDLNLFEYDYIIQPSSFWSRKIWETVGPLSETVHFAFDWKWFLKVANKFEIKPIPDVISMYRIHEAHKSGNGGRARQEEILKIYQEFNPKFAILYSHLMNDDIEVARDFMNVKLRLKEKLGKHTSIGQKLRLKYPSHYDNFTNLEIETAICSL